MEERFHHFTLLISGINRCIRRLKAKEMNAFSLKGTHVSCLHYLNRKGPLTTTELAEFCHEDKANISRAVRYLEKQGYLVCSSDARRRYAAPFSLTERGRAVAEATAEKIGRAIRSASEGLSDAERATMYHALAVIEANLSRLCDEPS